MKITDVRTVLLTGPITDDPSMLQIRKVRSVAMIELHTDSKHVGIGETYAGYFCPEIVPQVVEFYAPILIGQNVDNIAELWSRCYRCGKFWGRVGLGAIVLSGIEAALWDLKGKLVGLPAYELLGGRKHDELPAYATGGPSNFPKDNLFAKVERYMAEGFRAVKLGSGAVEDGQHRSFAGAAAADFEAHKLQMMREHFGDDLQLMLDGHMDFRAANVWDLGTAKAVMKALEPFGLLSFEEPLPYTDPWGYGELAQSTHVPIAGGECLTTVYEWRVFAERDCFDIGQPDAAFVGGLGEFLRVAAMLDSRGRRVAPHSWGAGGALMQNIHVGFAAPNTCIMEIPPAMGPLHREMIGDSFVMRNGKVLPPQTPGLGIQLTGELKERFPFVPGTGEFASVPGKPCRLEWSCGT